MTDEEVAKLVRAVRVYSLPSGGHRLEIAGDALLLLMPVFEAEGAYGNGPAWEAIIEYLMSTDDRFAGFELDSESDAALCAFDRPEPLNQLRALLLEAAANPAELRRIIREARAAGFGDGDL